MTIHSANQLLDIHLSVSSISRVSPHYNIIKEMALVDDNSRVKCSPGSRAAAVAAEAVADICKDSRSSKPAHSGLLLVDAAANTQGITHHRRYGRRRSRHVHFPDEAPDRLCSDNCLVTLTSYRPLTPPEEKEALYYNSQDYELFAFENYVENAALDDENSDDKVTIYGWEDCLVHDAYYNHDAICNDAKIDDAVEEHDRETSPALHKVKTFQELQS